MCTAEVIIDIMTENKYGNEILKVLGGKKNKNKNKWNVKKNFNSMKQII